MAAAQHISHDQFMRETHDALCSLSELKLDDEAQDIDCQQVYDACGDDTTVYKVKRKDLVKEKYQLVSVAFTKRFPSQANSPQHPASTTVERAHNAVTTRSVSLNC
eukprot:341460_1